jgi:hypothetical protein
VVLGKKSIHTAISDITHKFGSVIPEIWYISQRALGRSVMYKSYLLVGALEPRYWMKRNSDWDILGSRKKFSEGGQLRVKFT